MKHHCKEFALVVCLLQSLPITWQQHTSGYFPKIWEVFSPCFQDHSEMPQLADLAGVVSIMKNNCKKEDSSSRQLNKME